MEDDSTAKLIRVKTPREWFVRSVAFNINGQMARQDRRSIAFLSDNR